MANTSVNKSTKSTVMQLAFSIFKTKCLQLVLSVLVFFSLGMFLPSFWAQLMTTLFGLYLHFILLYSRSWSFGERDRNLVMHNYIQYDPLKGLKAGLISSIPLFLLTIGIIIEANTTILNEGYRIIFYILTCPYSLITMNLYNANLTFLIPLIIVIAPIFTWIGFKHGYVLKEPLLRFLNANPNSKKELRAREKKNASVDVPMNKPLTAADAQRPNSQKTNTAYASSTKKNTSDPSDRTRKLRSR